MDETLIATLVDWRRQLHARPELSGHEAGTAQFVQDRLRAMEIPFVAGVGGHGIVATLTRGGYDRSVGLRADMDALPIHEATGAPHASITPGVMHACGHDGHTVSLLGPRPCCGETRRGTARSSWSSNLPRRTAAARSP